MTAPQKRAVPKVQRALAPCPFCGGRAEYGQVPEEESPNSNGEFVQCTKCLACTALMFPEKCDVKPLLLEKWNTRSAFHAGALECEHAEAAAAQSDWCVECGAYCEFAGHWRKPRLLRLPRAKRVTP